MTAPDLKPCPFCGEADQDTLMIQHLEGTIRRPAYRVCCDNCGASTRYSDQGDHVAIWNTRATPAAMTPEVRALVDLLREARSDLEVYVGAEYPQHLQDQYPSVARQYHRDMELCRRIDAALAALRAGGDG